VFGFTCRRPTEDHEAHFRVSIRIPFLLVAGRSDMCVHADCLVVTIEVAFEEVTLVEGVLD
jgi:hypothetical protein